MPSTSSASNARWPGDRRVRTRLYKPLPHGVERQFLIVVDPQFPHHRVMVFADGVLAHARVPAHAGRCVRALRGR